MHIDLTHLDPAFFFVRPVTLPGVGAAVQIAPRKQKHRWLPEERHLRSLLCRPDGEILSSGLPKFFNLGEDADTDLVTRAVLAGGQAWFTEKMDGSLIIRDVLGGQVHLRTRGLHTLPPGLDVRVRALITERYPALLDPDILPGGSLLLEYTSDDPEDRIIVPYPERRLTALGWMDLSGEGPPRLRGTPEDVAHMAERTGTVPVPLHALPGTLEDAVAAVAAWTDREGVVVRGRLPDGSMHLVKLKSLRYLRNHTVRFHLTPARLATFCWVEDIREPAVLRAALHAQGVDWEVFATLVPAFEDYRRALHDAEAAVAGFQAALEARLPVLAEQPMAAAVPALKALCAEQAAWASLFPLGIRMLRGEPPDPALERRLQGALALQTSPGRVQSLEEDPEHRARARDLTPGLPDA